MPYVGKLRTLGLAKESSAGTLNDTISTFLAFDPPESIFPAITLLEHKGIAAKPDMVLKASQGPAKIDGAKYKIIVEPQNIGEILMATFGTDTVTEVASFTVSAGVNDKIDFTEDGGSEITATLTAGTYAMGATSAVAGSLCALIKAQMEAVNGSDTYTVSYSYTTKKLTITKSGGVFVMKWSSGTNTLTSAKTLLGFTNADTSSAISCTSDSTTTVAPFSHAFTRLSSETLPTYTHYVDKGLQKSYYVGAMMNKFTLEAKKDSWVMADVDFNLLKYDSDGTQTATYSTLNPFTFPQAVVTIGGSANYDCSSVKIEINNSVKTDHVVGSTIWPTKIWSEGFGVTLSADMFLESTNAEYAKFIAGTESSFSMAITGDTIVGSTKYSLSFNVPSIKYSAAPLQIQSGVMSIPFAALGYYNAGITGTATATLVNTVSTSY